MKDYLILQVLREPKQVALFSLVDWDLLIRQARRSGLLARLYFVFSINGYLNFIPERVLNHFISDWVLFEKQSLSVKREIIEVREALRKKGIRLCLMKGAAYVLSDIDAAKGRLFSDIDLIVPVEQINEAEQVLMNAGWMGTHHSEYDRKYYRKWMHEIPPLKHVQRQTVLDVHHNILPLTIRNKIDAKKILDKANNLVCDDVSVLCPEDLVLHSAAHLFHEGEFNHGLRDISDLDMLLREFSSKMDFWASLLDRADELNLGRQLFYAVRYAKKILNTPIPTEFTNAIQKNAPNLLTMEFLDFLFLRALMPAHASCNENWSGLARWMLYVRSHWLRMPLYLLIPHLARKSWMWLTGKEQH